MPLYRSTEGAENGPRQGELDDATGRLYSGRFSLALRQLSAAPAFPRAKATERAFTVSAPSQSALAQRK